MTRTSKDYFNEHGCPILDEKLYGSEPTGFADFNRSRYSWVKDIYDTMLANTWFVDEVNTSTERKNFNLLTENEQQIYKYVFAQLSFNDSAQTKYLADFQTKVSNTLLRAVLVRQAYEEVLHSQSYATLLDACGNSQEVFDLYKTDDALRTKNEKISEHFSRHIQGTEVDQLFLSAMASVNLEGVYFLTGFGLIYTLGSKVQGANDTIAFINRDEFTHLPLFANIVKGIAAENKLKAATIDKAYEMMQEAVDIELEYSDYLLSNWPIMGLYPQLLEDTVKNYANDRLKAIGLKPLYPELPMTSLQKMVNDRIKLINSVRTNFFEGNVKNYSKNSLDVDDF